MKKIWVQLFLKIGELFVQKKKIVFSNCGYFCLRKKLVGAKTILETCGTTKVELSNSK